MCGIAGIVGLPQQQSEPLLEKMTQMMVHRGPDSGNIYADGHMCFGHRRLSIIDLSEAATQPFVDDVNQLVIVFNGEIYNYQTLRSNLDYPWKTNSDTEVILAAYLKWGYECLSHFSGMFAFAIYDKKNQSFFIARDRLGVKPFYYSLQNGVFCFASEIRAIMQTKLVEVKLDENGLMDYLQYGFVRCPNTILSNIKQLNPGTYGILKDGQLSTHSYWHLVQASADIVQENRDAIKSKVRLLLEQSVKDRMVADVEVGAYLSGGIDSSSVVALMSGMRHDPIHTFSIVFNEKDFDESEYSNLIAKKYQTKHTSLLLKPEDLIQALPHCFEAMDHPSADGVNTFVVSGLVAKTGIKVVLSGSGGDELFAGYPGFKHYSLYKQIERIKYVPFLPELIGFIGKRAKKKSLIGLSFLLRDKAHGLEAFYLSRRRILQKHQIARIIEAPMSDKPSWMDLSQTALKDYPKYSQYSIAELSHYTMEVLLKDTDQMSMAHALEVREPLFDYRLIEYLLKVKDADKLYGESPKSLLVDAMGELLPKEIVYRPKKGFTFPWNQWLKHELKSFCEAALTELGKRPGFKSEGIQQLWHQFLFGDIQTNWVQIWQLVVLEHWLSKNQVK